MLGLGRLKQGNHNGGKEGKAEGRSRGKGDPEIARSVSWIIAEGTLTCISLKSLSRGKIK